MASDSSSHAPRVEIHWMASFGEALAYTAAPLRSKRLVMLGVTRWLADGGITFSVSLITSVV
ncbi:hypothetical protein PI125_g18742 [Phytophthora idaei]|nr:hypothetical protein PI125_g18742 [Phytophthora idaei]